MASLLVIFLWWYLVLPTKLRLWQRTETTSSSLVQLRFHINKLKCIPTVCKVNRPAFKKKLWHLLFRHLADVNWLSKRAHSFWNRFGGSGRGLSPGTYSFWVRTSQLLVWRLGWTFDEVFTGPLENDKNEKNVVTFSIILSQFKLKYYQQILFECLICQSLFKGLRVQQWIKQTKIQVLLELLFCGIEIDNK